MSRPWYVRRELELALLVVSTALAAYGVNAALRLAADDDVPPPASVASAAASVAIEPLEAWAPIAARDIFNGARAPSPGDTTRRLVGVGFQAGEARAAIEDLRTHRQDLVG